jgi:hypothetical protein
MVRTIEQIKQDYLIAIAADAVLAPLLTKVSNMALFKLMIYVFSFCVFVLENLWTLNKSDVNETIDNKDLHSDLWYVNTAKDFQYGYNLPAEGWKYDNTGIADDVVVASKIVAYAAFETQPKIRMKVAKKVGSDLAPLSATELAAFTAYRERVKDAGIKELKAGNGSITSTQPDNLRLVLKIRYNPLVLNNAGQRLDGSNNEPVKEGVKNYLQNLDFNGVFSTQKLVDRLQIVEGVKDLQVQEIQAKYGALPFTSFAITITPDSGYFIIDNADLIITYEAQ